MERILIESAIRAVLLAIAAAAVLKLLRITTASGRHAAWTVVLLTMLTLPVWTLWGPKAALPVLPTRSFSVAPSLPIEHVPFVAPAGDSSATAPGNVPRADVPREDVVRGHASNISWRAIALTIYGLGVVVLLGRLIVGTVRAQRIIRRAEVRSGHLTSRHCSAPVTVGWFHPLVMLPHDWDRWSPAQLDAVLLHEREHARRRDPLIQWFALLNRTVFWFHPLAWWLERRLAALAEDACDAAVLARGHQPAEYCEYLLSLARGVTGAGGPRRDRWRGHARRVSLATHPPDSQGEVRITDHAASAHLDTCGVCRFVRCRDSSDAGARKGPTGCDDSVAGRAGAS
jgi:beta-lactamase regulating signal transducer with metallopeptidase domain